MSERRRCARCDRQLSDARQRFKHCGRCEPKVKREQKERAHARAVERTYGLLPGDYQAMYEAQGGKCAIAKCRARGITRRLAVEHDHKIGNVREAVRGLVCSKHNEWIGQAGDDPEVFASLAAYLINPPAREVLKG